MNRFTLAMMALVLAGVSGSANGAMIGSAGTGYSAPGYASDVTAELRNLKNSGDFEIGLKRSSESAYLSSANAVWIKGVNDFVITYDTATNVVSVSLNGAAASTALAADPGSVTFHLTARNAGSNTASLTVQNLSFNGSAIGLNGMGAYLFASSDSESGALSNITNARIDDAAMVGASWTIAGQIVADWTGPAPSKSNSRVDVSLSSVSYAQVPAPGGACLGTLAISLAALRRTRPTTS